MKNIIYILPIIAFFSTQNLKAQLLFNEDFDSYPAGDLNTDYTGATAGQGGWTVSGTGSGTAIVTPEVGRGNVITISSNSTTPGQALGFYEKTGVINTLWNNRSTGNNVLKLEYEISGTGTYASGGGIVSQGSTLIYIGFLPVVQRIDAAYWESTAIKTKTLKNFNVTPYPDNTWVKVEMFIDYNDNMVYFYSPSLNTQLAGVISHNRIPEELDFYTNNLNSPKVVKFDNIKLSAIQSLPPYILSVNDQLAAKFNMYPNPATNVVNITNSENMLVNQVTVYDIAGKQLSTQAFNNENEIQLNVENLTSGTYMLHLQTEEGTAVKKLVKK